MEFLTLQCSQKIHQKTALTASQSGCRLLTAELGLGPHVGPPHTIGDTRAPTFTIHE